MTAFLAIAFFYSAAADLIGNMLSSVPYALLTLILLLVIIGLTTLMITRTLATAINNIDFDAPEDIYDELNEFFQKILRRRRQSEEQMRELQVQSKTSNALIENMQDGFVMVDPAGTVITANPRALELFEADQNPEGKNIICLLTDSTFLHKVDYALAGEGGTMTLRKQSRLIQLSFLPSANNGAIILATDYTEKEQADKMRREFSANVSHELKTPLTTIGGYAEMIMAGLANPKDIGHFAEKINTEAKRMTSLIENILFLSKLDEQDIRETFTPCDISELAAEAIESLSRTAETQRITVSLIHTPCVINCNKLLIYEMLFNLINNAIQYNVSGGKVEVTVGKPAQSGNGAAYQCRITISDTGIGISKEAQDRIFERFYRVEQSRGRKTGGAGLGLSIVHHVVRYHNGDISFTSEPGKGTQFDINL